MGWEAGCDRARWHGGGISRCVEISEFSVVVSKVSVGQQGTNRKMLRKYVEAQGDSVWQGGGEACIRPAGGLHLAVWTWVLKIVS